MSNAKSQHENFIVDEATSSRKRFLRQDRHDVTPGRCFLVFQDQRCEVLNYSYFGLAIAVKGAGADVGPLPKEIVGAKLFFDGVEVQELHLLEVRRSLKANAWADIGYEVIGEPVQIERMSGLERGAEVVKNHAVSFKSHDAVPAQFKHHVYEIKDWLESLQRQVNEAEEKLGGVDGRDKGYYEEGFMVAVSNFLTENFPAYHSRFAPALESLSTEQLKACAEFFRQQLNHLIFDAPISKRAYEKPRGYAGDYEMMNLIYRSAFEGPNLFAKCLHHYLVHEPAGQAVRNRSHYLRHKIIETFATSNPADKLKFMSVASGPAREVQLFLQQMEPVHKNRAEFVCLDQDEESLKYAQRSIKLADREVESGCQFRFVNKAIRNVIGRGLDEEGFDLIYSAGLFDYLSDAVAQMTATKLYASLKPGGRLIIGNFNLHNPSLPIMTLAWDWHLIYRSPEDLRGLFQGIGSDLKIEEEGLGINLFCVIYKK